MSNIFAPLVRYRETLPVEIGTGPIVGGIEYMHLWVDDAGSILCSREPIAHYGDGLPFDENGRLVISEDTVSFVDQGIPFTASGAVAVEDGEFSYFDQGVPFTENNALSIFVQGSITPGEYFRYYNTDPGDFTVDLTDIGIPDFKQDVNIQLVWSMKQDFSTVPDSHVWARFSPVIVVGEETLRHEKVAGNLQFIAANTSTDLRNTDHIIGKLQGEILDWRGKIEIGTIMVDWIDKGDRQEPTPYDSVLQPLAEQFQNISTYFRLVAIRIITPEITEGEILAWPEYTLPAPIWSSIPDTANFLYELPVGYDVSSYVSSVNGLQNWQLIAPPAGFSVDGNGVVTADNPATEAAHVITVSVDTADSVSAQQSFTWTLITGNVPTWGTIPTQQHRQDELPRNLDVKPYASSDSGPILSYSLVLPPSGITILNGVITVAAGTAVSSYVLTVRAINGVGAADTVFTWDILEPLKLPEWSTIPNQTDVQVDLPNTLDTSPYVTTNAGPLVNWNLKTPPPGFTVDQNGVVTVAAGTAIALHSIVVAVSNDLGEASTSFTWDITPELLPPQWSTIPDTSTSEELLPSIYDVSAYVSSNSGLLTGWNLVAPPAGFSINGSGVITAADTLAPAIYSLTVNVANDTGNTDSAPFDWEIILFFLPPQWSTIPAQSNGDDELPVQLDVAPYVTSNSGPLTGWALVAPPAGFSINASGVITVAGGTAPSTYSITVEVDNDEGTSSAAPFNWTISSVLLPPQWATVPDQSTREDNLPQNLDLTGYVTTNSGPLTGWTLVSPPAGFSVNTAGLLTVAAGTSPSAGYSIQAQVTNNTGTSASNIFSWEIEAFFLPPQWSTIPNQSTEEQLLPVVLDVKPYVSSNHGTLTNWQLVSPPGGWTIDSDGIITVAAARPVGSNSITVRVSNDSGSADSAAFQWDILEEPLPPQWSTIPGRLDRENELPQQYDISSYADSNAGPLTGWQLVSPPAGFSINGAGVITAAGGTAVAIHTLTVRVSNDVGSSDSAPFQWEIGEELLPPQWSTVPDQSDRENTLPQTLNASLYVTSNSGTLVLWRLASAPAGFSINSSSGVVTAQASLGPSVNNLQIGVTNAEGESLSNVFEWEILEELLPPQWSTIPNRQTAYEDLPDTYDVSSYVTSNSGPLDTWSLVSPPTGFSINQSGVITASTSVASDTVHNITVRVFNDEGGADQSFNWTIDAPLQPSYFHEFNADLGGFTFARASNATWERLNTPGTWDTVGTNQPVYEGCDFNGSIYVPTAGYKGLVIEHESTNFITRSRSFDLSPWVAVVASRNPPVLTANSVNGNIYFPLSSFANDKLIFSFDSKEGSQDQIFANWSDRDDDQLAAFVLTADYVRYYLQPVSKGDGVRATRPAIGVISGAGTVEVDHIQVENDTGRETSTSRIISDSGSTTTRAYASATRTLSSMGFTPTTFDNAHAGQIKMYLNFVYQFGTQPFPFAVSRGDFAEYAVLLDFNTLTGPNRSSCNAYRRTVSGGVVGVQGDFQWTEGDLVDLRWSVQAGTQLKFWINGVSQGSVAGNPPTLQTASDTAYVGVPTTTAPPPQVAVKELRLVQGVVSDAEVEAWT